jgi:hypothetical protein
MCRYENGEEEHCLELWNRDGKVFTFFYKYMDTCEKNVDI